MSDIEEDAEERRADDEHDGAGCPGERQHRLQRVSGEAGDLVLPAVGAKGGRLVGEGRLQHPERNREDEDDGEQRRERPVRGRAEQTADDDVERVVRCVEQAEYEEEQERLPEERLYSRRSKRGRDGGPTSTPSSSKSRAGRRTRKGQACAHVRSMRKGSRRGMHPSFVNRPPSSAAADSSSTRPQWALVRSVVLPLLVSLICLRSLFRDGYLLQVDIVFGPRPGPLLPGFGAPVSGLQAAAVDVLGGEATGKIYAVGALFLAGFAPMILFRRARWYARCVAGLSSEP